MRFMGLGFQGSLGLKILGDAVLGLRAPGIRM